MEVGNRIIFDKVTGNIFVIEDITNEDYKVAVEEFISNIATQ